MTAPAAEQIAYTLDDAAAAVGLSARTLRRAINDSELVAYYVTKARLPRIRRDDLIAWVESHPTDRAS